VQAGVSAEEAGECGGEARENSLADIAAYVDREKITQDQRRRNSRTIVLRTEDL